MSVGKVQCPLCPTVSRPYRLDVHMWKVHKISILPSGNVPYVDKSVRGREWKEKQKLIKPKLYSGQFESNRRLH